MPNAILGGIPTMSSTPAGTTTTAVSGDFSLNIFPALFTGTTARVLVGLWRDTDHAEAIAATIPGLVTWRDPSDASRMYVWHATETISPEGFHEVTVTADENPQLFQKLLDDAVRARMLELGFTEKHGSFVNYGKGSLLTTIPALSQSLTEPIGIYPRIILEGFFTRNANEVLVHGIVADVLYTTRFDVSVAELVQAGLGEELLGEYVLLMPDAPDVAQYPNLARRTIGSISGYRGNVVTLNDRRDETLAEIATTAVMPEPTRPLLEKYLTARYQTAFTSGQLALQKKLRELVQPGKRFKLTNAVRERVAGSGPLQLLPGLTADIGEMIRVNNAAFPARQLTPPRYSFDPAGDKLDRRIDSGLHRFGPYDRERVAGKRFRILVIAPTDNKGDVSVALTKLQNGLRTSKNVFGGLRSMYRLGNVEIRTVFATVAAAKPMAGYAQAVTEALKDTAAPFDLALVVIHARHRELPDSENPYFQTKALLLSLAGIPTQALTIEKLRKSDDELQYILNNAVLACYAKMGGTSHVLRAPASEDGATELVFGIGRALTRTARLRNADETIGFATVFRANGEYLYNDCTPYCHPKDYERALEETIKRSVERVAEFEQLPPGSVLRLIFHVHRRTGKREVQPILNAVRKLPKYKIEYALLHVNEDHPIQLYERQRKNSQSGQTVVGVLPERGISVFLGPRERLVTFVGMRQYRGQGMPMPLRVTLDRTSTFKDLEYIVQQMFALSFMSARSMTPAIKPVTIGYAEQLARMTGHLRGVQAWTVEMIQNKLGRKLWFI
jgi:hypothetical protein